MNVQVNYQNLKNTQWVDNFINKKVEKLSPFLDRSSSIQVHVKHEKKGYVTSLAIHYPQHELAVSAVGENLYEAFADAVEKARRALRTQKDKIKNKINRRFYSLKKTY
ncbi:MAG: ribosome hibernation-promoting factor, HPF/YfiA family [Bacteriovoracaceae bacterium]